VLIFDGDSTGRQLFNRLIAYLRGIPTIIEQRFKRPTLLYVATPRSDRLEIFGASREQGVRSAATAALAKVSADADAAAILYLGWGPAHDLPLEDHYPPGLLESGRVAGVVQSYRNKHVVYVPSGASATTQGWTNATLRASLNMNRLGGRNYQHNFWGLSSEKGGLFKIKKLLVQENWTPERKKEGPDLHFQCAYNTFPEPIRFAKVTPDGDCRDIVGLNAIHLFVQAVLDPAAVWE
jgi:hypothetical protein